jgi:hypothetical protein
MDPVNGCGYVTGHPHRFANSGSSPALNLGLWGMAAIFARCLVPKVFALVFGALGETAGAEDVRIFRLCVTFFSLSDGVVALFSRTAIRTSSIEKTGNKSFAERYGIVRYFNRIFCMMQEFIEAVEVLFLRSDCCVGVELVLLKNGQNIYDHTPHVGHET